MERFTILLAVPSPLYAPLYLAKVKRYTCFDRIDFDYAGAPVGNADPLIDRVLAVAGKRRTVMAVGDPMRILSTSPIDNHDTPVVVGGLVTRMCYWALDHKTRIARHEPYWEKIRRIVAHPIGMTAYAVLFHDMFTRGAFDVVPDNVGTYTRIDDYIIDDIAPGFERQAYRRLQDATPKNGKSYGFLTMDPADYVRAVAYGDNTIRSFMGDEPYRDVVMTGLVTGLDLYARRTGIIDDIREGIVTAVRDILQAPDYAAYLLQGYQDQRFWIGSRYSEKLLMDSLVLLADEGAYSSDLRMTACQVRKSKEVREPAERLLCERLGTAERAQREARFASLEDLFYLDDPVQSSSRAGTYSVVGDLLASRTSGDSGVTTHKEKFVLRYIMSPSLLLIAYILSTPKLEELLLHAPSAEPQHLSPGGTGLRVLIAVLACFGGIIQVNDVARVFFDGHRLSIARLSLACSLLFVAVYLFVGAAFAQDMAGEVTSTALVMTAIGLFGYHWKTGALSRAAFDFRAKLENWRVRTQIRRLVATERASANTK